jgi:hypothetical protein
LTKIGFSSVQVELASGPREMPHYRQLVLTYRSGSELVFDFDQGMGYWTPKLDRPFDTFDENGNPGMRVTQMRRVHEKARVTSAGVSYTPVYVELRAVKTN